MSRLNEEVAETTANMATETEQRRSALARQGMIDRLGFDPFAPPPPEAPQKEAVATKQDPFAAIRAALTESPVTQVAGGIRDAIASTLDIPTDLVNLFKEVEIKGASSFIPEIDKSDSTTLGVVRSASQFMTDFAPIFGGLKGVKAIGKLAKKAPKIAQTVRGEVAGAIAGASAFDPDDPNLSNLINDLLPALRNPVTDFLSTDPDDKAALNRFRNAVEGLGLGALTEGFLGSFRAIRSAKGLRGLQDELKGEIEKKIAGKVKKTEVEALEGKAPSGTFRETRLFRNKQTDFKTTSEPFSLVTEKELGKPYKFKPLRIDNPSDRIFYHGTKANIVLLTEADPLAFSQATSLFGPGLYLTDSPEIARGYAKAGRVIKQGAEVPVERKVFSGKLNKGVELYDLEAPLTPEAETIFIDEILSITGSGDDVVGRTSLKKLFRKGQREGFDFEPTGKATGRKAWNELVDELTESGFVSTEEAGEVFAQVQLRFHQLGFDGFTHKGGQLTKKGKKHGDHNVVILWDVGEPGFDISSKIEHVGVQPAGLTEKQISGGVTTEIKQPTEVPPTIDFAEVKDMDGFNSAIKKNQDLGRARLKAKRGKRPIPTSQQAADLIGMTKEDMKNIPEGTAFNAENIIAAGDVVRRLLDDNVPVAEKVATGTATKEEIVEFLDNAQNISLIDPKLFGVRGESGRALQALSVVKPTIERLEQIAEGLTKRTGGEVTPEQFAGMYLTLMKETTPVQTAKWLRITRRIPGMIMEFFLSSLLSGIKTHEINFLGNLSTTFMAPFERAVAARLPMSTVVKGESTYMMYGMTVAMSNAFRLAGRTLKTGIIADEGIKKATKLEGFSTRKINAEAFELANDSFAGRAVNGAGALITLPLRALLASDVFFKTINRQAELYAQAVREASEQNLTGNAAGKFIKEFVDDPDIKFIRRAEDFAAYQTFTNDVGKFGTAVQNFANSHMFAKFFLPFVRTPINIFKFSYERTPLGGIHASIKQSIKGTDPVARDLAISRLVMSSAASSVFAAMTAAGSITGSGPANKETRNLMRENGWQPNSFKIGNTFVSYSRADPIGQMIGDVADFVEASQYLNYTGSEGRINQIEAVALGIAMAYSKNMLSKTYVTGMQNAMDIAQVGATTGNLGRSFAEARSAGRKFTLAFMPTIAKDIAKAMDPVLREADTYAKAWKAVTPYYSQSGFAERNVFGEVVVRNASLTEVVNPLYITHDKNDIVMEELIKRKAIIPQLPNWIGGIKPKFSFEVPKVGEGIKLTDEQQDFWKIETGKGLRKDILNVINTSDYRFNFSDFEKQQELLAIQTEHRQEAKEKMIQRFGLTSDLERKEAELDKAKQAISELINR